MAFENCVDSPSKSTQSSSVCFLMLEEQLVNEVHHSLSWADVCGATLQNASLKWIRKLNKTNGLEVSRNQECLSFPWALQRNFTGTKWNRLWFSGGCEFLARGRMWHSKENTVFNYALFLTVTLFYGCWAHAFWNGSRLPDLNRYLKTSFLFYRCR